MVASGRRKVSAPRGRWGRGAAVTGPSSRGRRPAVPAGPLLGGHRGPRSGVGARPGLGGGVQPGLGGGVQPGL